MNSKSIGVILVMFSAAVSMRDRGRRHLEGAATTAADLQPLSFLCSCMGAIDGNRTNHTT